MVLPKHINQNTLDQISLVRERIVKAKNTLDYLLGNSKIINLRTHSNDSCDLNNTGACTSGKITITPVDHCERTIILREEPIFEYLQKTVDALSLCTEDGYFQAIEFIGKLNEIPFQENNQEIETKGKTLGDRIFFHLYLIHKKESPNKINPSDMNYGSNAFQTEGGSTAEEKFRAAQRVQVDILLSCLELSFRLNDNAVFIQVLDILESMKLDTKDVPSGLVNLTHGLFGKMYKDYFNAYEEKDFKAGYNLSWVHPHDKIFNGDFGRNAFVGDANEAVPRHFKLQVVLEFIKSVKGNWGI